MALCGVTIGVSVWLRQDIAAYSALTFILCMITLRVRSTLQQDGGTQWRSAARAMISDIVIFSLMIVLIIMPMVMIYWLNDGLLDFIRGMTIGRILSVATVSEPFVSILDIFSEGKIRPSPAEIVLLYMVLLMFFLLYMRLLFQIIRNKINRRGGFDFKLFSVLLLATMYFAGHQWPYPQMFRLPQDGALIYILAAYSFNQIYLHTRDYFAYHSGRRQTGKLIGVMLGLTFLLIPGSYIRFGLVNESLMSGGLPLTKERYTSVDPIRGGVYIPEDSANELNRVTEYIFTQTDPEDTVFAPSFPLLYFLTDRRNATRQVRILPSLAEAWAAEELIEDLVKNRPRVVVLRRSADRRFLSSLPSLFNEIARNYSFAEWYGNHFIFVRATDRDSTTLTSGILHYISGDPQRAFDELKNRMNKIENDQASQRIIVKLAVNGWGRVLGMLEGYLIWEDGTTWHIRWRGNEKYVHFTGKIISSLGVTSIRTYGFDVRDQLVVEDNEIRFDALTPIGVEGLDIYLQDNSDLTIDIIIDKVREPQKVYIGVDGVNPSTIPFAMP
jgi:hypothetical protein